MLWKIRNCKLVFLLNDFIKLCVDKLQLVGGSAGSEQTDEKENAPDGSEATAAKSADGYTEGIPGPVTRLFVLANRGIANLIQDLILVSFNLNFI